MNEEMKVAELMKPRIMCVEPFLGMKREGWELNLISTIEVGEDYQFLMSLPVKYPLNFKLLPWWSHRKIEDMPGYVKKGENGKPRKIAEFYPIYGVIVFEGGRRRNINSEWIRATLHDYEQYTNHKTV